MHRTLILYSTLAAFLMFAANYSNAQTSKEEFGKCGYYADALQGRKTASGEKYDKNLLTCAHKTLPFGTMVRVTRLDNKKSVVVRVNDRGPFMDGYVTDISRKAAEAIGLVRDGVTRVKLQVVEAAATDNGTAARTLPQTLEPATYATTVRTSTTPASGKAQLLRPQKAAVATTVAAPVTYSTPTLTAPATTLAAPSTSGQTAGSDVSELYQIQINTIKGQGFGLQVGVLTSSENLFQEIAKLQATWPGKIVISHEETGGNSTYKLILGPYNTRKEAEAQQKKASSKGYKKSFVVEFQ